MNCANRARFYLSDAMLVSYRCGDRLLDRLLSIFDALELVTEDAFVPANEVLDLGSLGELILHFLEEPVFVVNL